jgi:hypothetical protein
MSVTVDLLSEDGPRRKLERASTHLDALNALTEHLRSDADFDSVVVEHDHNAGNYVLCSVAVDTPLDKVPSSFIAALNDLGLVLGDFIHNARGALDHVTWKLATRYLGHTPTKDEAKRIQFPIRPSPKDFASAAVLAFVSTAAAAEMERMQPYHAVDPAKHPLAVLNWLSNRDKHQIVTAAAMGNRPLTAQLRILPDGCQVRLLDRDPEAEPLRKFKGLVEWRRFEVIPPESVAADEVHVSVYRQPRRAIVFEGPAHHVHIDELSGMLELIRANVTRLDRLL